MKTEARFLVAIVLMLGVLVGTNLLFPPIIPDEPLGADSTAVGAVEGQAGEGAEGAPAGASEDEIQLPFSTGEETTTAAPEEEAAPEEAAIEERVVTVEGPLYRFRFSNVGARLVSGELLEFESLREGSNGLVGIVPEGLQGYFGQKIVVGSDTVDLSNVPFRVEPEAGVQLSANGGPRSLRFIFEHSSGFRFEQEYEFNPDSYIIEVSGSVGGGGLQRPLLVTDLGAGLPFVEADSVGEARMMAYVSNSLEDGIRSEILENAEPTIVPGPLLWAAFRNKFFVLALLADRSEDEEAVDGLDHLGGLIVGPAEVEGRVRVATAQSIGNDGAFSYSLFMGPQDYARLSNLGQDMEEVNPYGWRFFRPIIRPFVSVIMAILVFLHTNLDLGYGWVLVVFGVMMRVILFPLNHKAMRAQLRNMAVQPLVQEIQTKYKDNPEKLQKEMMRLYKEHGFNPLAGCLPMLLPWPVLIALFFVFQNTIELRGVEFLWLPDLSAPDPLYLLPFFLGLSMFLMQLVSLKSLDKPNKQMQMMMYIMPVFMVFIFFRLASGLNLYYATANIATIPQQILIARERKKMRGKPPPTMKSK